MNLDSLLERINERHQTETTDVALRGLSLKLLQIKDMAAYIEQVAARAPEGRVRLPYWAKVWEASLVLADYLLSLPEFAPGAPPRRVVELGAGMGVPGLFLAAAGHEVSLTDCEAEALEFAQATALLNNLRGVNVRCLDWAQPGPMEPFDAVIGSELFYHQDDYPHLARLLTLLRKEGATAYLAKGPAVPGHFYEQRLRQDFELSEVRRVLRSPEETIRVSIFVLGAPRRPEGGQP